MSSSDIRSNRADAPYWRALDEGTLRLQRCEGCARWHWPAVWRCGECGAWDLTWQKVELRGTVFTWTRTHHPFAGTDEIAVPYVSLVVELPHAGGRRVLGRLIGDDASLRIGAVVEGTVGGTAIGGRRIPALEWRLR